MSVYKLPIEPSVKINSENLCRHCGRCCVQKTLDPDSGQIVFHEDKPCPHLKQTTDGGPHKTFCDIYDKRLDTEFEIEGKKLHCLSAKNSFLQGGLPRDCPYSFYYAYRAETLVKEKDRKQNAGWIRDLHQKAYVIVNKAIESGDWSVITKGPKTDCKHCFVRGYEGRDIKTGDYLLCRCVTKQLFF